MNTDVFFEIDFIKFSQVYFRATVFKNRKCISPEHPFPVMSRRFRFRTDLVLNSSLRLLVDSAKQREREEKVKMAREQQEQERKRKLQVGNHSKIAKRQ